jgi:hypothetical protein
VEEEQERGNNYAEWEEYFMKLLEGRKGEGVAWMHLGNRTEKVGR